MKDNTEIVPYARLILVIVILCDIIVLSILSSTAKERLERLESSY